MIAKAAKTCIALADHSKFGKQSFTLVGPVKDIDILVTDSATNSKFVDELREAGLEVLVAESAQKHSPSLKKHAQSIRKS
jgi:DeoR/GlpR family transcriptional regulator of sugar metabolism